MHSTLSLILYKIPYHRLLLVHLFIYHLIARPTMGNYYILKFRKWFKYGLGASALYLCFTLRPAIFNSLRPVTVGSGRVGLTCESSPSTSSYILQKRATRRPLFSQRLIQMSHKYCIQQIFILGNPLFCLIIVKLIIGINSKGDSILIKLLRHE